MTQGPKIPLDTISNRYKHINNFFINISVSCACSYQYVFFVTQHHGFYVGLQSTNVFV